MRCTCGYETSEVTQCCPACGRGLFPSPETTPFYAAPHPPRHQQTPPPHQQNQPYQHQSQCQQYQYPQPQQHQRQKYQSLGGFLLVLVILVFILVVVSIANTIWRIPADFSAIPRYLDKGTMVSAITFGFYLPLSYGKIILELIFALMVITRRRHIITLMAAILLSELLLFILNSVSRAFDPTISGELLGILLRSSALYTIVFIIVAALILVYLLTSVRVRTFMRSDSYITQGIWRFVSPPVPAVPDSPANVL